MVSKTKKKLKVLTGKALERAQFKKVYHFIVGVELFSRYAFVKWFVEYNPYLTPEQNKIIGDKVGNITEGEDLGTEVDEDAPIADQERDWGFSPI